MKVDHGGEVVVTGIVLDPDQGRDLRLAQAWEDRPGADPSGGVGLSVEADNGQIVGVALVTGAGRPIFDSARLYGPSGAVLDEPEPALRLRFDPVTG